MDEWRHTSICLEVVADAVGTDWCWCDLLVKTKRLPAVMTRMTVAGDEVAEDWIGSRDRSYSALIPI